MDKVQNKVSPIIFANLEDTFFQKDAANQATYEMAVIDDLLDDSQLLTGMLIW